MCFDVLRGQLNSLLKHLQRIPNANMKNLKLFSPAITIKSFDQFGQHEIRKNIERMECQ